MIVDVGGHPHDGELGLAIAHLPAHGLAIAGKYFFTNAALTTAGRGDRVPSFGATSRPRSIRVPLDWKYPGPTASKFTSESAAVRGTNPGTVSVVAQFRRR